MKKSFNWGIVFVLSLISIFQYVATVQAENKEYVYNSEFTENETPEEFSWEEDTATIVDTWYVQLPEGYGWGWNPVSIGNGKASIYSDDMNISTILNGEDSERRSPALNQNVKVQPNQKYTLEIDVDIFSGDSSYLVINNQDLSSQVNGFIDGDAMNKPVYNYKFKQEVIADESGLVPISIYMQHAPDRYIFSGYPFNVTISKVRLSAITEPSQVEESSSSSSTEIISTTLPAVSSELNSSMESSISTETTLTSESRAGVVTTIESNTSSSTDNVKKLPATGQRETNLWLVLSGMVLVLFSGMTLYKGKNN
ncbi:LPXTG cell wall anchor domain-containing protein [Candidatus Enterococcus ikei]|uniref:LPXTG cell wall anchor domain-containing protein n=1 Tax=Candidatus Enterococcus ikei TaxID=2815326 RepID=A0ABS3GYK6_9ENTE|nr:LPXTG cell wall anchor domain-containing protein [Enterococcus sp. DIV0869a]MBO0440054.1 LPXTG cell wall anchor domain-containing protein [Enterococcus sp. DIV0869a]